LLIHSGLLGAGTHRLALAATDLLPGAYVVRATRDVAVAAQTVMRVP
jgi:hypothetical protein